VGSPSSVQRQVAFEAFDDFSMSADNPRLLFLAPEDWDALTHAVDLVEERVCVLMLADVGSRSINSGV
jgi:hypothetical protein